MAASYITEPLCCLLVPVPCVRDGGELWSDNDNDRGGGVGGVVMSHDHVTEAAHRGFGLKPATF